MLEHQANVVLVVGPTDDYQTIMTTIKAEVPGIHFRVVREPYRVSDALPYLETSAGARYVGSQGIRDFIQDQFA
jgi:hypothetical protein